MNEFLTWDILGTYAGCLAATVIATEYLKKIFPKIHPQITSFVIALVILIGVAIWGGAFKFVESLLYILNAAVISLAANGGFDAMKNMFHKDSDNDDNGQYGGLVIGEDQTAYINFNDDPKELKEGQKVTFVVKKLSQE